MEADGSDYHHLSFSIGSQFFLESPNTIGHGELDEDNRLNETALDLLSTPNGGLRSIQLALSNYSNSLDAAESLEPRLGTSHEYNGTLNTPTIDTSGTGFNGLHVLNMPMPDTGQAYLPGDEIWLHHDDNRVSWPCPYLQQTIEQEFSSRHGDMNIGLGVPDERGQSSSWHGQSMQNIDKTQLPDYSRVESIVEETSPFLAVVSLNQQISSLPNLRPILPKAPANTQTKAPGDQFDSSRADPTDLPNTSNVSELAEDTTWTTKSRSSGRRARHSKHTKTPGHSHICDCGAGFAKKAGLRGHCRNVHSSRQFKCDECGGLFLYRKDLRRHNSTQHVSDPLWYYCRVPNCTKWQHGYHNKDALRDHISTKHTTNVGPWPPSVALEQPKSLGPPSDPPTDPTNSSQNA